jgi:hypothetical protein
VTAQLSQGTAGWHERDKTLKSQLALQAKLAATPEYGVAEMTQLFREQLNDLARGDRELTEMFIQHHKEGLSKGRQFLAGDLREKSGGATQEMAFSVTGRVKPVNRKEKRKKTRMVELLTSCDHCGAGKQRSCLRYNFHANFIV